MPRVAVKRITDAGWRVRPELFERELRRAVNAEAKPEVLKMMKEVIEGKRYSISGEKWEHDRINFRARFQMRGQDAILYAYPSGPDKEYWTWTSRGTRPHGIDAKNAPYLVFPIGGRDQMPKTPPAPRFGAPIIPSLGTEKWVSVKHVDHPGTKPREFEERIMKDYAKDYRKLINNTIRNVIRLKNR